MSGLIDLTGQRFGRLTVIERVGTYKSEHTRSRPIWKCQCDCGNYSNVTSADLRTGNTQSCGCQRREHFTNRTHGLSKERLYGIYIAMKTRCRNNEHYEYISVCDEWLNDYHAFRAWALENGYKENLTIDRIDNEKGYEPSNCRWVTMREQAKNRRCTVIVIIDGKEYSLRELSEITRISQNTLAGRAYFERPILSEIEMNMFGFKDLEVKERKKRKCHRTA